MPTKGNKKTAMLMVCYAFPSWKAIGAIRNYNIAKQALSRFGTVRVLSTANHRFLPRNEQNLDGIAVHRLPTVDYHTLLHWKGGRASKSPMPAVAAPVAEGKMTVILRTILNTFPFNALIGEGGILYILCAFFRGLRLSRDCRYLYSSFSPFADHLVAWMLKKCRPELLWIADFRDCYTHPDINPTYFPGFHRWMMRRLCRRADLVTTVSHGLAEYFKAFTPHVHVLRNAVDQKLLLERNQSDTTDKQYFRICYTGLLYAGQRDPSALFQALKTMSETQDISRMRLAYAGANGALWNSWISAFGLESINEMYGEISHAKALELQQNSAINLLLTWSLPTLKGIMTGKFYEYLSAQKPILLLINGEQDLEFEAVFNELRCGLCTYNRKEAQTEILPFLEATYQGWLESGQAPQNYNMDALQSYTWENQFNACIAAAEKTR